MYGSLHFIEPKRLNEAILTYIGKAGTKKYISEQDYTGLAALSPDDPNRVYVSSPFNPGDDNSKAGKREIWRGTAVDNGQTWQWEAITANSSEDNFRPVVPKWKKGKEALLWFRGTYSTAQIFSTRIFYSTKDSMRVYLAGALWPVPQR